MKIIVAGTGFVGLTHAAVCSEYGHEVYAYDIDERKLAAYRSADPDKINHYVNEPGLPGIIAENMERYLFFRNDLEPIIEGTDAIFLCLPTPPNLDGHYIFRPAGGEHTDRVIARQITSAANYFLALCRK